jgi:hypothetical protein
VLRNRRRTHWRNRRLLGRLAQERGELVENLADRIEATERMRRLAGPFSMERTGIEPVTSGLQSRRSPS